MKWGSTKQPDCTGRKPFGSMPNYIFMERSQTQAARERPVCTYLPTKARWSFKHPCLFLKTLKKTLFTKGLTGLEPRGSNTPKRVKSTQQRERSSSWLIIKQNMTNRM